MKIGIVISTDDPEIMWNAFRFANLCLERMDDVQVFLNAKAVHYKNANSAKFNIKELVKTFALSEGKLLACGKCLSFRGLDGDEFCLKGSQKDLYEIVTASDKLLCF